MQDVIFFDKDGTLHSEGVIFPGVDTLLDGQREKSRQLYVVTYGGDGGKEPINEILDKFEGYFGKNQIGRE